MATSLPFPLHLIDIVAIVVIAVVDDDDESCHTLVMATTGIPFFGDCGDCSSIFFGILVRPNLFIVGTALFFL